VIRITFLGCDSTHTEAFANRINPVDAPFHGVARVVSIWGEDRAQCESKASALGIERVASTVEEALQGVDLAMVIGRFGDSHLRPALAALEAGIPTFVDKPFTVSSAEAQQLADRARALNVPLMSASPLRFASEISELKAIMTGDQGWGCVAAAVPATCTDLGPDPRLQSAFFYGIHGLEMLLELTGHAIEKTSVTYASGSISVVIELGGGRSALFELMRNAPEFYEIGVFTRTATRRVNIALDGSYYQHELAALFGDFLAGRATVPLASTLTAIELLERIDRDDPFSGRNP
jgi:predicted dehydrogenase